MACGVPTNFSILSAIPGLLGQFVKFNYARSAPIAPLLRCWLT